MGYSDDAALIDYGDALGIARATERLSAIARGSRIDAYMTISIPKAKTKAMHVRAQEPITATSNTEASKVCKFICPHLNCGYKFLTKRGMLVHAGRCEWKEEFEIERILDCKGEVWNRKYLIHWKGYTHEHDTWEPRNNLHPEAIMEFEKQNNLYVTNWTHRCPVCYLPCRSQHGVKIHFNAKHREDEEKQQKFLGTLADKKVQEKKWEEQQKDRHQVSCEGNSIDNVYKFKYLGSLFSADGRQIYDIRARVAMAMKRCGQLRHLFDSPNLGPTIKIRL